MMLRARARLHSPAAFAALLTFLLVVLSHFVLTPVYNTNDDVGLRLFFAGGYYGAPPLEFVLFIHIFYAKLLVWLYAHFSGFPWYDSMLLLHLAAGAFMLLHSLLLVRNDVQFRVLCAIAGGLLVIPFFQVQYTLVAGVTAGCGMVCAICACFTPMQIRKWPAAYGFIAITAGTMLRFEPALMACAFTLCASLPLWFRRKTAAKYFLPAGAALLCAVALHAVHLAYFRADPAWRDFPETVDRLHMLGQYNPMFRTMTQAEAAKHYAEAFHWSSNDFEMFRAWFYSPLLVNDAALRQGYAALEPQIAQARQEMWRIFSWTGSAANYAGLAAAYIPLVVLLALGTGSLASLAYMLYLGGGALAILTLLEFYTKPVPFRIYYVFVPLIAALVLLSSALWKQRPVLWRLPPALLAAPAAIAALLLFNGLLQQSRAYAVYAQAVRHDIEAAARQLGKDGLFMTWIFPHQWITPFAPIPAQDTFRTAFSVGVFGQSPFMQEQLARYGLRTVEEAPCGVANLYVVSPPPMIALLKRSLREHFHQDRHFTPAFKGKTIVAYRCDPAD